MRCRTLGEMTYLIFPGFGFIQLHPLPCFLPFLFSSQRSTFRINCIPIISTLLHPDRTIYFVQAMARGNNSRGGRGHPSPARGGRGGFQDGGRGRGRGDGRGRGRGGRGRGGYDHSADVIDFPVQIWNGAFIPISHSTDAACSTLLTTPLSLYMQIFPQHHRIVGVVALTHREATRRRAVVVDSRPARTPRAGMEPPADAPAVRASARRTPPAHTRRPMPADLCQKWVQAHHYRASCMMIAHSYDLSLS
jgi:hypothetical protein